MGLSLKMWWDKILSIQGFHNLQTSPLNCRDLASSRGVAAELEGDQLWMLLLGGDLHHGVQGLSGLNVGEAPPWGDLTQTVHVSGCDQQVAGKSRESGYK